MVHILDDDMELQKSLRHFHISKQWASYCNKEEQFQILRSFRNFRWKDLTKTKRLSEVWINENTLVVKQIHYNFLLSVLQYFNTKVSILLVKCLLNIFFDVLVFLILRKQVILAIFLFYGGSPRLTVFPDPLRSRSLIQEPCLWI